MKDGARQALAEGLPLKGVILASPLTPKIVEGVQISGSSQISCYADGQLTGTTDNADKPGEGTLAELVLRNSYRDYQNIIIPRRAGR